MAATVWFADFLLMLNNLIGVPNNKISEMYDSL